MRSNKLIWFGAALVLLVGYFVWDSYSQPDISSIKGRFEEVAFVRNEQNKGGIIRIYAVTVQDVYDANYEACAETFPVNDFGSYTKIYFFDKSKPYPTELSIEEPHFDTNAFQAVRIIKKNGSND